MPMTSAGLDPPIRQQTRRRNAVTAMQAQRGADIARVMGSLLYAAKSNAAME